MNNVARIMVVTDDVKDAEMIAKILRTEFSEVTISTTRETAIADFDRCKPDVLILAYTSLNKSERYHLGLYRQSTVVQELPHQTLILCDKNDVNEVYTLCKEDYFDDYILYWPLSYDTPRLLMSVSRALRDLEHSKTTAPLLAKMTAQARQLADLETFLQRNLEQGEKRVAAAGETVDRMEAQIDAAVDGFSERLLQGGLNGKVEIKDSDGLKTELLRFKQEGVKRPLDTLTDDFEQVRQWPGEFRKEAEPHIDSARALKATTDQIRRLILIVDDDGFQCKVLSQILGKENFDLVFVASGTKVISAAQKRRPDLILMDIGMPDLDGMEVTRRLKASQEFAQVPVIMITGQSGKDIVMESLKAGAVDFVVKPFDKEVLLKKVHKYVHRGAGQA